MAITAFPESATSYSGVTVNFTLLHTDGTTIPDNTNWYVDGITQTEHGNVLTLTLTDSKTYSVYADYTVPIEGDNEVRVSPTIYYIVASPCAGNYSPRAVIIGGYRGPEYVTRTAFTKEDVSRLRVRYARDVLSTVCISLMDKSGWVPAGFRDASSTEGAPASISGNHRGKKYTSKTSYVPGMFSERDRVPRIGVHQTVSGYGIPVANIIISGKLGISTAVKTDGRGVWWSYLPMDDYSKADIRSFTDSGKVYLLLKQVEREEGYIWDEVMKRIGKSGAGQMMVSRQV